MNIGTADIITKLFVFRKNIVFPPLYFKLGLMKLHIKALNTYSGCFKDICRKFPQLRKEKLKQGIFE